MKPIGVSRTTLWRRRKLAEKAILHATGIASHLKDQKHNVQLVTKSNHVATTNPKLILQRIARRRASKLSKSVMLQDSCMRAGVPIRVLETKEKTLCVPFSIQSAHVPKAAFTPISAKLRLIVQTFQKCNLWTPSSEVHMRLAVDATVNPKLTHIAVAPICVDKVHSYTHFHSLMLFHGKEELNIIRILCQESKLQNALQTFRDIPIKWFLTADHVGHQVMGAVAPACVTTPTAQQCPWCNQTYKQRHTKRPFDTWNILHSNRVSAAFPFIPPNRRIPCLIHGGMNVLGWVLNDIVDISVNMQHGGKIVVQSVM